MNWLHRPLCLGKYSPPFPIVFHCVSRPYLGKAQPSSARLGSSQTGHSAMLDNHRLETMNIPNAHPNLVSLSSIGTSLPVVLLNCLRIASEICSSLACSTADSLL